VSERWIVVRNWERFQHYKDREPVWIKLYLELRSSDEWRQLTLSARGLLVCLWIEYAAAQGVLRASDLPSRVAQKNLRHSLESLQEAGFIEVSASKPLAFARSREKEKEKERETPKPPFRRKGALKKIDQKARAWIDNNRGELRDVDLAYVIGDQFEIEDDPELLADLVAYARERMPR
jgi:hypothetical protein